MGRENEREDADQEDDRKAREDEQEFSGLVERRFSSAELKLKFI